MLKRPIVTEKSMRLATNGFYTFEVHKDADKKMIAKLISNKFKVDVISVKTMNVKGKVKQQKRVRKNFQKPSFKKAIVQLKKGQKLALFETIGKQSEEVTIATAEGEPQIMKEKKDILGRTKVRVEKGAIGSAPTTQRKVITGK